MILIGNIILTELPVCIIAGCGPGLGASLCKKYHSHGYHVVAVGRHKPTLLNITKGMENVTICICDLTVLSSVKELVRTVVQSLGVPSILIYNAGQGLKGSVLEASRDDFDLCYSTNVLGLFNISQELIPYMKSENQGCILVSGATASLRGSADFAAFCAAKSAQRSLVQSLCRAHSTDNIHIAYIIIDGIIDSKRTREYFQNKPDQFFIKPEKICESYFYLTKQHPSCWTQELDLRTSGEEF